MDMGDVRCPPFHRVYYNITVLYCTEYTQNRDWNFPTSINNTGRIILYRNYTFITTSLGGNARAYIAELLPTIKYTDTFTPHSNIIWW